ncbi:hypothetical protein DFP74_3776 [Nocardiopsis sp. Huas11]|uniref:hypothetical protein n=1 Tax=Nocardiopsis sp. Huas11 TaxID=2183912 RepID=UPI000EB40950|nr:hypothetical protein [Nocardiopsis sp. Huas11]RKS08087.1 hypothetical protein DFP74_3776 [Nocardiopsis sp. Huas11]
MCRSELRSVPPGAPFAPVRPRGGAAAPRRARAWLVAENDTVTMVVLFVFGGVFVAKGSGVLLG